MKELGKDSQKDVEQFEFFVNDMIKKGRQLDTKKYIEPGEVVQLNVRF